MTTATDDLAMQNARERWFQLQDRGVTQEQIGLAMGYDKSIARKAVSQFLKAKDPRIGTLRRYAKAVNMPLGVMMTEWIGDVFTRTENPPG